MGKAMLAGLCLFDTRVARGRPAGQGRRSRPCNMRRALLLWPGVVAAAVQLGRGSYVALVTPMDAANAVDYGALRGLLEWHVASGTDGVVALGTTGEASTLDAAERDRVLETCVDACRGRVPVVAGTGAIDTRAVVAMGRRAKALGADGTLVVTPYYVKPPQRALEAHFLAVAEAVDLPMVLYNVPGRTGVDLLPETVARLAAHPNVRGIKEATGDNGRVAALRDACGGDLLLYSGEDAMGREFVELGGDGVISVTANVAPAAMARMLRAPAGAAARAIDDSLRPLHEKLFCQANPIPVKYALHRARPRGNQVYGAFVLISARWRGHVGSSPLDGAPDTPVDFHAGARGLATGIRPPLAPLEAEFHADIDAALAAADAVAVK